MNRLAFFTCLGATLAALASCSFSPAAVPEGGADGAPLDAGKTIDAALADAPPVDAPVEDGGPDGAPELCPLASKALALSSETSGTISGNAEYDPTCTVGSTTGGVDFYRLDLTDVPTSNRPDLVVLVKPKTTLDAIVDITPACRGAPSTGICEDSSGPGAPEIAVVPNLSSGRRYIAVDSMGDSQGQYSLIAFQRAAVAKGAICDPELLTSRCPLALYCVDLDNDGTPRCEERSAKFDVGANDDACTTATKFDEDGVLSGSVNDALDVDVVELAPADPGHLLVLITNDTGGCSADLKLELLEGASCNSAVVVATDDNGGLGPCPRLDTTLGATKKHWLRVSLASGARVHAGAPYTMVIDFAK